MDECVHEFFKKCIEERMHECLKECIKERMHEIMYAWMNACINE